MENSFSLILAVAAARMVRAFTRPRSSAHPLKAFAPSLRQVLKILLLLVAGLLVGAGLGYSYWPSGKENGLRLTGVVETQEVRLGSKIGGRVERVHVAEGTVVNENQPLVTFETPELEAQVRQWEARLRQAEADRDKACK